jgi:hypothetical protein
VHLRKVSVPYVVIGDCAVAALVSTVDEAAVRNTRDVDMLVRRSDLDRVRVALESVGFVYRHTAGLDVFLDDASSSVRDAVHVVFANEKVREHEPSANPDVEEYVVSGGFRILPLEALVRIKLTAYRDKDRTHLRDMLEVGLIDSTWPEKFGSELGLRLQALIDDHSG